MHGCEEWQVVACRKPMVARCRFYMGWDWFWRVGQQIDDSSDEWIEVVW